MLSRAKQGYRDAQKEVLPGLRAKLDFFTKGPRVSLLVQFHGPEAGEQVLYAGAVEQPKALAGDFRSGAIEQKNPAVKVGGEKAAAHGFDDVLVESLKILELFALLFQFNTLGANRAREQTSQIGNRQEGEQIDRKPGLQGARQPASK